MTYGLRKKLGNNTLYNSHNNVKYLGVTLTKQVKDLYDTNFKSLKKEMEEDDKRWEDLPYSLINSISILKMGILQKAIYRFNAISIKIPRP